MINLYLSGEWHFFIEKTVYDEFSVTGVSFFWRPPMGGEDMPSDEVGGHVEELFSQTCAETPPLYPPIPPSRDTAPCVDAAIEVFGRARPGRRRQVLCLRPALQ